MTAAGTASALSGAGLLFHPAGCARRGRRGGVGLYVCKAVKKTHICVMKVKSPCILILRYGIFRARAEREGGRRHEEMVDTGGDDGTYDGHTGCGDGGGNGRTSTCLGRVDMVSG